jgi:membrane associated rhomboid family serine protease
VQAGFLRVFLIYFISGIGGYSVAGIFAPGQVAVGADPAVFGLIAVALVELFQAWQV